MIDTDFPPVYNRLRRICETHGFTMPSDPGVGRLLRTLCRSKPGGRLLELGTGVGYSLAWMLEGMDGDARCISLDNDEALCSAVREVITGPQVEILAADGDEWLATYSGPPFDLIFADTWPGKYRLLEEAIGLLRPGGLYVVDDMLPQENWPEGHAAKAEGLRKRLLNYPGLAVVELPFSTGVLIGSK